MDSIIRLSGKVTTFLYDKDGNLKQKNEFHNIVTTQGDGLIADLMQNTPVKQKLDNTHGYIVVGTGWTGTNVKNNAWVNTQTGTPKPLSVGYPQLSAAYPNAVVNYQVLFIAGDLNASGINEVALCNGAVNGVSNCLAYAQISPSLTVTSSDTLQVLWQITLLGQ
jgi:hypothetical protein